MNRRCFIARTMVGTLALGLPDPGWWASPPAELRALAQPALRVMLGDRRVRELGLQYREMYPEEREAEILGAAILSGDTTALRDSPTLHAYLTATIRDDFAAGRTVLLKGWVLSVTEARQCALFSLIHP